MKEGYSYHEPSSETIKLFNSRVEELSSGFSNVQREYLLREDEGDKVASTSVVRKGLLERGIVMTEYSVRDRDPIVSPDGSTELFPGTSFVWTEDDGIRSYSDPFTRVNGSTLTPTSIVMPLTTETLSSQIEEDLMGVTSPTEEDVLRAIKQMDRIDKKRDRLRTSLLDLTGEPLTRDERAQRRKSS